MEGEPLRSSDTSRPSEGNLKVTEAAFGTFYCSPITLDIQGKCFFSQTSYISSEDPKLLVNAS